MGRGGTAPKDDQRLMDYVSVHAEPRGISVAGARFSPFKELSFRWKAPLNSVSFYASDYMADAPDEPLRQFVQGAWGYMYGRRGRFGEAYVNYIRSDEFVLKKRPLYINRSRNITYNTAGAERDICDAVQRLLDHGLLHDSDIDNTFFSWTAKPNYTRLGYCSQVMRLVAISRVMDSGRVPERAFDYVVYHECLHLRQGYRPFDSRPHDAEFRAGLRLFPGWREAEGDLARIPGMRRRDAAEALR